METTDKERERAQKLFQAFGEIKDEYVEDAAEHVRPDARSDERTKIDHSLRVRRLSRYLVPLAAALVLAVAAGAFYHVQRTDNAAYSSMDTESAQESDGTEAVASANPYVEAQSAEEAGNLAGVAFNVPDEAEITKILGTSVTAQYFVLDGSLAEADYADADGNALLTIREEAGTDDISGDYTDYPYETTETLTGGAAMTLKGNSEDEFFLATWTDGTDSFSIQALGTGLSLTDIKNIAEQVASGN